MYFIISLINIFLYNTLYYFVKHLTLSNTFSNYIIYNPYNITKNYLIKFYQVEI